MNTPPIHKRYTRVDLFVDGVLTLAAIGLVALLIAAGVHFAAEIHIL